MAPRALTSHVGVRSPAKDGTTAATGPEGRNCLIEYDNVAEPRQFPRPLHHGAA